MPVLYIILSLYSIIYLFFSKATGKFFKSIIYTAIFGVIALIITNFIGIRFQFNCPINTYTLSISALLGVPGVIFLLICNFIFC